MKMLTVALVALALLASHPAPARAACNTHSIAGTYVVVMGGTLFNNLERSEMAVEIAPSDLNGLGFYSGTSYNNLRNVGLSTVHVAGHYIIHSNCFVQIEGFGPLSPSLMGYAANGGQNILISSPFDPTAQYVGTASRAQ